MKFFVLRPSLKKSVFVKNLEIEINAWRDSPSSALSETLLVFAFTSYFDRNFWWFPLTSTDDQLVYQKLVLRFSQKVDFTTFTTYFLDYSAKVQHKVQYVFCLKEHQKLQVHWSSFFQFSVNFITKKSCIRKYTHFLIDFFRILSVILKQRALTAPAIFETLTNKKICVQWSSIENSCREKALFLSLDWYGSSLKHMI